MDSPAGSQGDAHGDPEDDKQAPHYEISQGVGEEAGHEAAHPGLLIVLLGQAHQHGEVGEHRGDGVGDGVADPVENLGEGGVVPQEHEHGDEHRGQESPLGAGRGHQDVDKGAEEDEQDDKGDAGKVDAPQEVGPADGDVGAQAALVDRKSVV